MSATTPTLLLAPLTDGELHERVTRVGADLTSVTLHTELLVPDRDYVGDRSAHAMRLRTARRLDLRRQYVLLAAAQEQRMFDGRITDWQRALTRQETVR